MTQKPQSSPAETRGNNPNQSVPGDPAPTCWALSEGHAGMEIQAVALARALGLEPVIKRVRIRKPWRWIPPRFLPLPLSGPGPGGDALAPPWPDVIITCGRQVVAPAAAIRRASKDQGKSSTFAIHIQDPKVPFGWFDVIVAPEHDQVSGPNVITGRGGINGITLERLAQAAEEFAPLYAHLPRPLIGVIIGGSNRVYTMDGPVVERLARQLAELAEANGAGLAVTPSRRTGAENEATLRRTLANTPAKIWDGENANPYFGILALADAFIVTCDSVNMVSEAATTGKPVHVVELEGGSAKFRRFHESLRKDGITRAFEGQLESWDYPALQETSRIAAEIRARMPEELRARLGA
ncbi:mitochondrial fission ELM1 family protein [Pelagibius sp. Alg239-R121]|uniref:mitochondrial fission ELM1 family protein n=1 Tax=Pelagibius sp. Alg239-R121 TaxID=2993448 RepID=UPI0024A75233|nr:mitochondrial fission ELM1 family protein [Pelagibius sp. Alg239-R121]